MHRRTLIKLAGGLPLMSTARPCPTLSPRPARRCRLAVGRPMEGARRPGRRPAGRVRSPLEACRAAPGSAECAAVFRGLKNPWAIGDEPALTQTSGWVDAWTSTPSAYAVAGAQRRRRRGGGQLRAQAPPAAGGEGRRPQLPGHVQRARFAAGLDAADGRIELHDAFVAAGLHDGAAAGGVAAAPARSGCNAYDAVTKAGRYVQGGGCTTVGVAGLIQSGGFGSFSKRYGLAAASLLEAEVVTADGAGAHRQRLHQPRPVLGA